MGYSSAFDDLLAKGRRDLDRMTGRKPAGTEPTDEPAPAPRPRGHTVEGTARGIPFRLRLKPRGEGSR